MQHNHLTNCSLSWRRLETVGRQLVQCVSFDKHKRIQTLANLDAEVWVQRGARRTGSAQAGR